MDARARETADILAVCDTLGVSDGNKYYKDPQCLSSTKDLILYLRKDTENHDVRRLLGEAQIVQKDLIPIFKLPKCEDDLAEVVLRLMVNLTNPPLLLYEHGIPKDKTKQNHFIVITRHLQAYKAAYIDEGFWTVIADKLRKLIENMETILENQKLTVERILILIRNVLQVPADPGEEERNDDDASIHDQILWILQKAGILDLLLFIAASDSTREFCMHIVETLTLIFREQTGEQLAKTKLQVNQADVIKDARELKQTMKAEEFARSRKQISTRNFGGTYMVRGLQAPSGNNQLCHKPVQSVVELSLDPLKKAKKTAKNRRELVEKKTIRRSTLSMRLLLKEFCTEFLNGAYNHLMRTVKDRLIRERGQEHDETYYLLAMRFFMEFNRYAHDEYVVAPVSETVGISTFHYVQGLIMNYHELMTTDKDNLSLWSKRSHAALRAFHELLRTLYVMEGTPGTSEAVRVIQSSIFYLPEYREMCVGLLTSYEPSRLSRNYFCDLVETNHIFLRMLEYSSREKRFLVKGKNRGDGADAEERRPTRECEFDFAGFMVKYAQEKIIANYANLFKNFETLDESVLHCVIKMFHRLVFDLNLPALLCQASVFRTFQSLLKAANYRDDLKVAKDFFKHFWPKFVKLATKNPKMFMEILFWKSFRDANEIQEGFRTYDETEKVAGSKKKSLRGVLSAEEENEIMVLAEEYAALPPEKGRKQVQWINEKLINGPKVQKVITNFLKEKGLLVKGVRMRKRKGDPWEKVPREGPEPELPDFTSDSDLSENEGREKAAKVPKLAIPSDSDTSDNEEAGGKEAPVRSRALSVASVSDSETDKASENKTKSPKSTISSISEANSQRRTPKPSNSAVSDSETSDDDERPARKSTTEPKSPKSTVSSNSSISQNSKKEARKRNSKTTRLVIASDSDESEDEEKGEVHPKDAPKPSFSSDSEQGDSPTETKARPKVTVSSDSDADDQEVAKEKSKPRKSRVIIDSDSD